MTNRLELIWKLDGFIDEQRYYCSEATIDPISLPPAKAILSGDLRVYTDYDVEVGKTYYIRVGSVKNGVEKISDEVLVRLATFTNKINLPLRLNAIDTVNASWMATLTNITFSDGAIFNGTGSAIVMSGPETYSSLPISSDFDLSLNFNITSFKNVVMPLLYKMYDGLGVEYQIWIEANKVGFIWYSESGVKVNYGTSVSGLTVGLGIDYELLIEKRGAQINFKLNSIAKGTTDVAVGNGRLNSQHRVHIGYVPHTTVRRFHGKIWGINLRVYE